jgi:hypothetical protein
MVDLHHAELRKAALAILASSGRQTRKAGSFLGQCIVDDTPLTNKQLEWFLTLAERANVEVSSHGH